MFEFSGHTPEAAPLSKVSNIAVVIPFNLAYAVSLTLPSPIKSAFNLFVEFIKSSFPSIFVFNVSVEPDKYNISSESIWTSLILYR